MGAAYFIVLDKPDPGFDPFVNGKAIGREARRLSLLAKSGGIKPVDDYVSIDGSEAAAFAEEEGVEADIGIADARWFDAEEGLRWVASLRGLLNANPKGVKDAAAVLEDLQAYEDVFLKAKGIGARWHLSVDF